MGYLPCFFSCGKVLCKNWSRTETTMLASIDSPAGRDQVHTVGDLFCAEPTSGLSLIVRL
jgi:hypothetical protein